jgi:PAS domain S-box-containing protein
VSLGAETLLDSLVDTAAFAVVVADLRGRILLFSPAATDLLGYDAVEACGHLHVTDLYLRPEEARQVMAKLLGRKRKARPLDDPFEVTMRSRAGELVPVRLSASLVRDDEGVPVASLGVFEDRREASALAARLEDATGQVLASEKRAAVVAMAASAAHELSQPLMAAMGNIELVLLSAGLDPEVSGRLDRAYEQLERMRRLVNDFARLTTARQTTWPSESARWGR